MIRTPALVESLHRIDVWLAEHAPASYQTLNPPATSEQIGDAFTRMGVPVPVDLATLLLRHNGTTDPEIGQANRKGIAHFLPMWTRLLSLEEIEDDYDGHMRVLGDPAEDEDEDGLDPWWHPSWVCFASSADSGVHWAVDQRAGGRPGAIRECDRVESSVGFSSLSEMMAAIATSLESGQSLYQHRSHLPQVVEDGVLTWDVGPAQPSD
ncbi:SMI1/KNR4 family protein [Actinomadura sp. NPDC049753]|uniref:SMI1/KNR4 family protein n=1 Tax=Actinomadura sp. NPDC049753 TaxID=3154739 RepID=UPI00342C4337